MLLPRWLNALRTRSGAISRGSVWGPLVDYNRLMIVSHISLPHERSVCVIASGVPPIEWWSPPVQKLRNLGIGDILTSGAVWIELPACPRDIVPGLEKLAISLLPVTYTYLVHRLFLGFASSAHHIGFATRAGPV